MLVNLVLLGLLVSCFAGIVIDFGFGFVIYWTWCWLTGFQICGFGPDFWVWA